MTLRSRRTVISEVSSAAASSATATAPCERTASAIRRLLSTTSMSGEMVAARSESSNIYHPLEHALDKNERTRHGSLTSAARFAVVARGIQTAISHRPGGHLWGATRGRPD